MAAPTRQVEELIQQAFEAYHRQNESPFPQNQYDRAEAFLREAIALDPSAIESRHHLANLYSQGDRFDEAAAVLEPIKNDPRIARDYDWFLLKSFWRDRNIEQTRKQASSIVKSNALSLDQTCELLNISRQFGFLSLYRQLIRQTGDSEERRDGFWIVAASIILRAIPSVFWRTNLRKCTNFMQRRGRWRKLRILLTAASFADRSNPLWEKRLGLTYRITRDVYNPKFLREQLCYENVLNRQPHDEETLDNLLITLNDRNAWLELSRRIPLLPSESMTSWRKSLQAMCLINRGDVENADRLYRELEATEYSTHARFCRGLLALETNQLAEARERFDTEGLEGGHSLLNAFFARVVQQRISDGNVPIDGQTILDEIPLSTPDSSRESIHANQPCVLCGQIGQRQSLWRDTRSGWMRARCPHCSTISVSPIPTMEEILPLYRQPKGREKALFRQAQKDVERYQSSCEEECRNVPFFRHLTEWEPSFCWSEFETFLGREKRSLDIGCTAGDLVMLLQQCGWRAEGIDVDPDAISFARSKGMIVQQGTLESLRSQLSTYHLVTLIDVIEHVQNPDDLVKQIYDILEPGGLFVVKTPCADSMPHRFLGDRWLESCEHLHFFSRTTLEALLEKSGFACLGRKQHLDETTPYLHPTQWKQRFFPDLLNRWIHNTHAGDTIAIVVQKPKQE